MRSRFSSAARFASCILALATAVNGQEQVPARVNLQPKSSKLATGEHGEDARLKAVGLDELSRAGTVATQTILATRVFSSPVVAVGEPTNSDNTAFAKALTAYAVRSDLADVSVLEDFINSSPKSPYAPFLEVRLAEIYYSQGRYSRSLAAYESGWSKLKAEKSGAAWDLASEAAAGCVKMLSRVGRMSDLENFFASPDAKRPMAGRAAENMVQAKDGLWSMRNRPDVSFRCGTLGLVSLARAQGVPLVRLRPLLDAKSTPRGFSLAELKELAAQVGLDGEAVFVAASTSVPVPSVVHWKIGHYAAIVGRAGDRFIVRDPTFGEGLDVHMTEAALREEASGSYFVPLSTEPQLNEWLPLSAEAAAAICGRGQTYSNNPDSTRDCDDENGCGGNGKAMAVHAVKTMLVSLVVRDTPIFYRPPYGPDLAFTLTYNEREQNDINSSFGNFGPRWSFNWLSWINESGGGTGTSEFKIGAAGGGAVPFLYLSTAPSGEAYFESRYDQSRISRSAPATYAKTLSDGTILEYSHPVGVSSNRHVMLTRRTDPQGNAVTLSYDTNSRLQTITDAAGVATSFHYELTSFPNRITRISLADGREAQFRYDSSGRLEEIEDMEGIVSHFTYGDAAVPDRITQLDTPYGATKFAFGQSSWFSDPSRYRWIEVLDPAGGRERIEFNERTDIGIPYSEPDGALPAVPVRNSVLDARNTFIWSKKAFAETPSLQNSSTNAPLNTPSLTATDYTKAVIKHWIHSADYYSADDHLESETRPGEGRVWYTYPGQTLWDEYGRVDGGDYSDSFKPLSTWIYSEAATVPGTMRRPSRIGRLVPSPDGALLSNGSPVLVSQVSAYGYNSLGRVTRSRDPEGRELRYTYAANGIDLLKVEQVVFRPAGDLNPVNWTYATLVELTYDPIIPHRVATRMDPARQTTNYTYNAKGQLRSETNALSQTTTYWYHPTGQGVTPSTTLSPTAAGYLVRIDGPLSGTVDTTHFTYDAKGRVQTVTEPSGYSLTFTYDNLDRLTRTDFPDATTEEIFYDKLDPNIYIDRSGRQTVVEHDSLRRPHIITDHANRVTRYEWCSCGALDQLVDARDKVTRFEYDVNGRLTHRHYQGDGPSGPTDTHVYSYDIAGRLASQTDPRLQVTTYRYHRDDKPAAIIHTGEHEFTPDTHLTYDPVFPRLVRVEDRNGTTVVSAIDYTYNPISGSPATLGAGMLAGISGPLSNADVSYTYDALGRSSGRTMLGQAEAWGYDALGRLETITNPLGTFTRAYIGATPRLDTITRPGGMQVSYAYRPLTEDFALEAVTHRRPDQTVVSGDGYIQNHLKAHMTGWTQTRPSGTTDIWSYGYTPADELSHASRSGPTDLATEFTYNYDAGGNRLGEQVNSSYRRWDVNGRNQLVGENTGGWTRVTAQFDEEPLGNRVFLNGQETGLDAAHRLEKLYPVQPGTNLLTLRAQDATTGAVLTNKWEFTVPSFAPKSFYHDANGNLERVEQDGVVIRFYRWDARNRLVAWGSGTSVEGRFDYDGVGQRIRERDMAGAIVRQWVWDGNARVLQERDGAGAVSRRYFEEGERRMVGGVEVSRYYTRDHLGSVRVAIDDVNNVAAAYAYDPYGRRSKLSGVEDYEVGFTGHYTHIATGLYFARFRAYDPDTARWLSRDPIEEAGGVNLYGYVRNNPLNAWDPWGLFDENDMLDRAIANGGRGYGNDFREAPPTYDETVGELADALIEGAGDASELVCRLPINRLRKINKCLNATDSSKNEKHGDRRAMDKAQRQIQELEEQLKTATGNEWKKIKQKIINIARTARDRVKGEEHGRRAKH